MAVKIIAGCTSGCGLGSKVLIGSHFRWGFPRWDYDTGVSYCSNPGLHRKYLHYERAFSAEITVHYSPGPDPDISFWDDTWTDTVNRLSGLDTETTTSGDRHPFKINFVSSASTATQPGDGVVISAGGTVRTSTLTVDWPVTPDDNPGTVVAKLVETLSSEYTDATFYSDLAGLLTGFDWGSLPFDFNTVAGLHYRAGYGDIVGWSPAPPGANLSRTTSLYQFRSAGNNPAFFNPGGGFSGSYDAGSGFSSGLIQEARTTVRMNYSVRLNAGCHPFADFDPGLGGPDIILPAAADISCSTDATGACASSTFNIPVPDRTETSASTGGYRILKHGAGCPQN